MTNKMALYNRYLQDEQYHIQLILRQANYFTAYGEGLDRIAQAIEIQGRTVDAAGFEETDVHLRDRIVQALDRFR